MSKVKSNNKSSKEVKSGFVSGVKRSYVEEVIPNMIKRFNYVNVMQVPKILSISLNMGIGDAKNNSKGLESALNELTAISGQKPLITKAKADISNFKIRKGYPVGCKVTLRSSKMYEFFERLVSIALPRSRDFRGLSFKSFDGMGNYSFGIKEQVVFAEIDYDKVDSIRGMDVIITTSSSNDDICYELLRAMGLPIKEKNVVNNVEEQDG